MANIITRTFFDGGELNIPGTSQAAIQENLDYFIAKYEQDYLLKAIGYPLLKLFNADAYPVPVTPRFIDLLNGADFTDKCGNLKHWIGLKVEGQTPIANYIWWWYQRDNVTLSSSMGELKGKAENAGSASIVMKQYRAWNEMSTITDLLREFLKYKTNDDATPAYPEFDCKQICKDDLAKISFF
jgi:hypothetical protein